MNPWQGKAGSMACQMLQGLALQVNQRPFPARMHYLQDERSAIHSGYLKVVVVLTWHGTGGALQAVELPGDPDRLVWRNPLRYLQFNHHGFLSCGQPATLNLQPTIASV